MNASVLGIIAFVPMMLGPSHVALRQVELGLCNGGRLAIPLRREGDQPDGPCIAKGCHASNCRKRSAATR